MEANSKFDDSQEMNPIFLYVAFQNIHDPYTTEQEFYDLYADRADLTDKEKVLYQ